MNREISSDKILRMRSVLERTGLSRSTIYRKVQEGTFPPKVKLSEHCCGWRESEINRWIHFRWLIGASTISQVMPCYALAQGTPRPDRRRDVQ